MSKSRQLSDAINSVDISESAPADAVTLDASGNLLVGKTASGTQSTVDGIELREAGFLFVTKSNDAPAYFHRRSSDGDIVQFRKDGTTVGSIGNRSAVLFIEGAGSNQVGLEMAGDILPRFNQALDSSGNVDIGASAYRFRDLYLSGGVYLGGTGAANYLDDYEEGTWTPSIVGGLTSGSGTYASQRGRYTKVGQLVMLQIEIGLSSHTGTGDIRIQGIPFTPLNAVTQRSAGALFTNNMTYRSGYTSGQAVFYMGTSNYIEIYMSASGTGWNPQRLDDDSNFTVIGTVYYSTAS